jgi:HK97 family phage prohead protease
MSETLEHTQETETAERPFLVREFQAAGLTVDGRTVDVRVTPFGEVAQVADPPDYRPYNEQFMPGCFDHQLRAANRIHANVNHSPHVIDVVGHGLELRAEKDGYHASFEIHETQAGETALALLRAGALPAVSAEFLARKTVRSAKGVLQRVKADLRGIAFCREGAYKGAQVLAVREEITEEVTVDAEFLPVEPDPELLERCRRLGIALPQRYQAHPEGTDTPDDSGTSESAPASTDNTDMEE